MAREQVTLHSGDHARTLENRNGLVRLPHYRGAFVAEFDAGTVYEAFELYGLLSALTNRRAAVHGDAGVRETLGKLHEELGRCDDVDEFDQEGGL